MSDPITQNPIENNSNATVSDAWSAPVQSELLNHKQQLLSQQNQIQTKYVQLKDLYQNNELELEQKQQIFEQMQKLAGLYTQNKNILNVIEAKLTWQNPVEAPSSDKIKKKKKKKLAPKRLALIVLAFITLIVAVLAILLKYLIQNPAEIASIWLSPALLVTMFKILSLILFVILFLAGLSVLWIFLYKQSKLKKEKKKSKSALLWIIWWAVLLIVSLFWWILAWSTTKNIDMDKLLGKNQLITPYLIMANQKSVVVGSDPDLWLIAPANVSFTLNTRVFDEQIKTMLWTSQIVSVELDCANGQTISSNYPNSQFDKNCFYSQSGKYPSKLLVTYTDSQWTQKQEFSLGTLDFVADISIKTNQKDVVFQNGEIILWKNPVTVMYDASSIFRNFQLSQYQIERDANGDGIYENIGSTNYTYSYTWAGLYYLSARFPSLNSYAYSFPIRIEQWELPVAYLEYTAISKTDYNISAKFYDIMPNVSEYLFEIYNSQTKQKINSITSKNPEIQYSFVSDGLYFVKLTFITQDGKQSSINGDDLDVGGSQINVYYDLLSKTPTKPEFQKIANSPEIIVDELPTIIQIKITNIVPSSSSTETKVLLDELPVVAQNNLYTITIDENKTYNIKILVNDASRNLSTERTIKMSVKRDDIIWELLVTPNIVGTSPFTVSFDASSTTLNDSQDEIVYFSRDFGDGEKKQNLSQSIIGHTYNYDYNKENGVFYPTVTVRTKKWRELLIGSGTMISVKKPNVSLDIIIESHPAQIANIGEKVDISINVNGVPEKIVWDFGNGNTLECKQRMCIDSSQVYSLPGVYTISASVYFADKPTVDGTVTLKVN